MSRPVIAPGHAARRAGRRRGGLRVMGIGPRSACRYRSKRKAAGGGGYHTPVYGWARPPRVFTRKMMTPRIRRRPIGSGAYGFRLWSAAAKHKPTPRPIKGD